MNAEQNVWLSVYLDFVRKQEVTVDNAAKVAECARDAADKAVVAFRSAVGVSDGKGL